jgi:hypothetical protein
VTDISPRSNPTVFWAAWVLTSTVGWAASRSALQIPSLNSAHDIMPWAVANVLDGALIGTIITFGQWLILRNVFTKLSGRFLATALLYPLGLLAGLLVFSYWGLAALTRLGGAVLIVTPSKTLMVAGAIIGIGQWYTLRSHLTPNFQSMVLWVLGAVLGLTLGGFYGGSHFSLLIDLTMIPQSIHGMVGGAFTGFVSGGVTGIILLILLKRSRESTLPGKVQTI